MQTLIHFFADLGTFGVGCVVVALSAAAIGFCGAWFGATVSVGFFDGSEDTGINKVGPWAIIFGAGWSTYIIFTSGLFAAFLASAGLALSLAFLGWLIWIFAPGFNRQIDPNSDDYPY